MILLRKRFNFSLNGMDPLIMYAISLHKYANDITEKIAKLTVETNVLQSNDAIGPIPNFIEHNRKHVRNSLNYIKKDFVYVYSSCIFCVW